MSILSPYEFMAWNPSSMVYGIGGGGKTAIIGVSNCPRFHNFFVEQAVHAILPILVSFSLLFIYINI